LLPITGIPCDVPVPKNIPSMLSFYLQNRVNYLSLETYFTNFGISHIKENGYRNKIKGDKVIEQIPSIKDKALRINLNENIYGLLQKLGLVKKL
jgi:hypothetical protein